MRPISAALREAIQAQETDEALLYLITITHAQLDEPVRVSSDQVDTVSRGQIYLAYPVRPLLTGAGDGSPPRAQLEIDHVDRRIGQAIAALEGPAGVTIEVVLGSTPDSVELALDGLALTDVEWDQHTVRGTLTYDLELMRQHPDWYADPGEFPGLHPRLAS